MRSRETNKFKTTNDHPSHSVFNGTSYFLKCNMTIMDKLSGQASLKDPKIKVGGKMTN